MSGALAEQRHESQKLQTESMNFAGLPPCKTGESKNEINHHELDNQIGRRNNHRFGYVGAYVCFSERKGAAGTGNCATVGKRIDGTRIHLSGRL
jgi:hypothetical protein